MMDSTPPAPNTMYFVGKSALIYGGAKGIGRAVALEWARRGARVSIADIDGDAAAETASSINADGGTALAIEANVLSEESVGAASHAAREHFGGIDIVMANVGTILNGNPEDIPFEEWVRILDLNYWGTMRVILPLLPEFLSAGQGHIVTTASFAGLFPYAAGRLPYASSKAAILSLSQNLALYLEPKGIRVSCLVPGPVKTDIAQGMRNWSSDCPMRGPGSHFALKQPEKVAEMLSDGMRDGQIIVPSDGTVWDELRQWAQSPDDYIRAKIADVAEGNLGQPVM